MQEKKTSSIKGQKEKVKKVKEFLRKYTGILKGGSIPSDITVEQIREMRLKERYDIKF